MFAHVVNGGGPTRERCEHCGRRPLSEVVEPWGCFCQPHVSESRRTRLQTTPVGVQANDTTDTLSRWHEFNGNPRITGNSQLLVKGAELYPKIDFHSGGFY